MLLGERYELGEVIGAGTMGSVHRGTDTATGRDVAIKRVAEGGLARRLEIESRVLARLRHPRVVRYLDHVVDDRGVHLVMELVAGDDLAAVCRGRGDPRVGLDEALELIGQAGEALHYIHGEHTVHRDVKPSNLIVSPRGVVVVDFGIARSSVEGTGTLAQGSPGFMAPEALTGETGPAADVYGLAATLWTLLRGHPPRVGERPPADGLHPAIDAALVEALDPDPGRRTGSIAAFLDRLGRPLTGERGRSLTLEAAPPGARGALSGGTGPETGAHGALAPLVRAAAGILDAAAVSIALVDGADGGLTYRVAWGAGADEIVGVQLAPGEGLAGAVVAGGEPVLVADCRADARFRAPVAQGTGYIPSTMLLRPILREGAVVGVLSVLDRRDGQPFDPADDRNAALLAEVAAALLPATGIAPMLDRTLAG